MSRITGSMTAYLCDVMKYVIYDIETTGLVFHTDQILSIGVKTKDEEHVFFNGEDEAKTLKEFWDFVQQRKRKVGSVVLVGYNSVSFDLPFIQFRSIVNHVPVVPIEKYREHIDLFYVLVPYGYSYNEWDDAQKKTVKKKGTLGQMCTTFGIPMEFPQIRGTDIPELWIKRDTQGILQHAMDDIRVTYTLFNLLRELNVIPYEYQVDTSGGKIDDS